MALTQEQLDLIVKKAAELDRIKARDALSMRRSATRNKLIIAKAIAKGIKVSGAEVDAEIKRQDALKG